MKIEFSTHYDDPNKICGYVIAEDCGDYYKINKRQYRNALRKRTMGGCAGIDWHCEKPVRIIE